MKSRTCLNCGNKLNEEALFCGSCGQKVIKPAKEIKVETNNCLKCNTPFEKDEKFCAECGTPINKNIQENIQIQQTQQVQKSEPQPIFNRKKTPSIKKSKRSVVKMGGKIVLGFLAFIIVGAVILYNLGDDFEETAIEQEVIVDDSNDQEVKNSEETVISINKHNAFNYRNGIGVEPDQYKAFELYEELANKGDLDALVELSDYYEQGIWVKKDSKKAKKLLQQAAEKGSLPAKWQLEFLESGK